MESTQPKSTHSSSPIKWLKVVLLVGFLIAAALTSYLTYIAVRDFITSYELTSLPGVPIRESTATPEGAVGVVTDPQAPLQSEVGPTSPPWDGAKRVTILAMGLDYRDWEAGQGPPRTDTMILFTIDPINRTAGMLSIPRDLWVNIPDFGYGRINTAYQLGEAWKYPGGGPGLSMATVEELLGVPIDYYAQIDFFAFEKFIDQIGGVKIDVPEKIVVDPLGDNNTKTLKPGRQVLTGELALAYARMRKTSKGDFDRAQRTQQVIMGVRDRILDFDQLPTLISKSGLLYNELSAGVHTNLNLDQIIRLSWLASQIPEDKIKQAIIWTDHVSFATFISENGEKQEVLKPITDKIRLLRDEIFADTAPVSPVTANMGLDELMKAENARVSVLNGTLTPGLAARTSEYFQSLGINVVAADNAQQASAYSEITFYTGKPYTVKYLVEMMKIDELRIHHTYDPAGPADIIVVLGNDWAAQNPMPTP